MLFWKPSALVLYLCCGKDPLHSCICWFFSRLDTYVTLVFAFSILCLLASINSSTQPWTTGLRLLTCSVLVVVMHKSPNWTTSVVVSPVTDPLTSINILGSIVPTKLKQLFYSSREGENLTRSLSLHRFEVPQPTRRLPARSTHLNTLFNLFPNHQPMCYTPNSFVGSPTRPGKCSSQFASRFSPLCGQLYGLVPHLTSMLKLQTRSVWMLPIQNRKWLHTYSKKDSFGSLTSSEGSAPLWARPLNPLHTYGTPLTRLLMEVHPSGRDPLFNHTSIALCLHIPCDTRHVSQVRQALHWLSSTSAYSVLLTSHFGPRCLHFLCIWPSWPCSTTEI